MNYTDKQLLDKVKSLPDFKYIPEDYWAIFVRSKADKPDAFDDYCFLYKGEKFITYSTCTTNPGAPILTGGWKKYTSKGAALIKVNQWMYRCFKFGLHAGKMRALRQIKNIWYHRDNNNNNKAEEIGNAEFALYNTNIHSNSYSLFQKIKIKMGQIIGNWSAGCLVLNQQEPYEKMINLTEKQPDFTAVIISEF
jgi:hypothetical protein